MGLERFFFTAEPKTEPDSEEKIDESKRTFLKGAAATAIASSIPIGNALGADLESPERRLENIDAIRKYQTRLSDMREILQDPYETKVRVLNVLEPRCFLQREDIEGTEFDHEAWFRNGCTDNSWPSIQVRYLKKGGKPEFLWAHQGEPNDDDLVGYGNCFVLDGHVISNSHIMGPNFKAEMLGPSFDISASSFRNAFTPEEAEAAKRTAFESDRRRQFDDIHGEVVHIPTLGKGRGRNGESTGITTGVAVKLTETIIKHMNFPKTLKAINGEEIPALERYLHSYMCIIPSRDTNNVLDEEDGVGTSGTLLFRDVDAALGNKIPSGIVWGVGRGESYTFVLFHGPDVLAQMCEKANTVVSMEQSKEDVPAKVPVTAKVQEALQRLGFYDMEIDGGYGEGTKQAVANFQRSVFDEETFASSVIDGVVDLRTWAKLFPQEAHFDKEEIYARALR